MEISNGLEIEILCTLQKISSVEEILNRNIEAKSEDLIVNQYHSLKANLCRQLADLLSEAIEAKVEIAV